MAKVNGMKPLWNRNQIRKLFDRLEDRADEYIIDLLKRTGDEFVRLARENGSYQDWTGNLRSSIGYVIVKDGNVLDENFQLSEKKGTDKHTGMATAKRLTTELAREYSTGYVLIGVAGMNYAAAVEATGQDVISLSADRTEDFIKRESKSMFDRLKIV